VVEAALTVSAKSARMGWRPIRIATIWARLRGTRAQTGALLVGGLFFDRVVVVDVVAAAAFLE
jgi:hypothetical protein